MLMYMSQLGVQVARRPYQYCETLTGSLFTLRFKTYVFPLPVHGCVCLFATQSANFIKVLSVGQSGAQLGLSLLKKKAAVII